MLALIGFVCWLIFTLICAAAVSFDLFIIMCILIVVGIISIIIKPGIQD